MYGNIKRPISKTSKQQIIDHVLQYDYDVFISIQLPVEKRVYGTKENVELKSRQQLYFLMRTFFKICCGKKWIKKMMHFHSATEIGLDKCCHYHLAMKTDQFNPFVKIKDCFALLSKFNGYNRYVIDVQYVDSEEAVINYINKQYNDEYDSSMLNTNETLFNVSPKEVLCSNI